MVSRREESQSSWIHSVNLEDYIITIPNILSADEYYEVLDYCEDTQDFERREKSSEKLDTLHQHGKRYDIRLDDGRIHDLIRKSLSNRIRRVFTSLWILYSTEFLSGHKWILVTKIY